MNPFENEKLDLAYKKIIADHIVKRLDNDEHLLNKMSETKKTLTGCLNYVKSEAKKQVQDGVAVIPDEDVFNWCVHYFLEDSILEEPKITKPVTKKIDVKNIKDEENVEDEEEDEEDEEENKEMTKPALKKKMTKTKKEIVNNLYEEMDLFSL